MDIKLIPLEKMIMDGKEIRLGDKKQAVISVLGEPEHIHENYGGGSWRHYYFDSELALDFDRNDRLEFIEFLGGHYGKLKPYIYGISVFDTKDTDVVRILSEHNNGEIDDSENDSFGFLETSIGIWKDSEDEEYWTTLGIGVKGYYTEA